MNKLGNILWGVFFVALAAIVGLNSLGMVNVNLFFKGWWTLFIIVPAFISFIKDRDKTVPLIFLLVGVVLLLANQELIDFSIVKKLIAPAILLIIGLSIIFKETISGKISKKIKELNKKDANLKDISAVFSGQEIKLGENEFKGLNLNAIFGGVDVSLENCNIDGDYIINTSSIFGGIDIKMPKGVNVEIKSTSIFGGTDSKIINVSGENVKTIYINAFNLFGGLDVK